MVDEDVFTGKKAMPGHVRVWVSSCMSPIIAMVCLAWS
eukprot:CAMPEP_0206462176 /NCGR_PEP_ID=MMETSP0324_2-20121206/25828_1 /ASSEMBLY_ACC=CAM_ASM_000836 /TAXON_ID=2866 /ORGANISM="Crypthecodinium cohnii, Strain Seligo" /LENGTH=37 /DNA_ID= /DNA_START= /DNA_END= /DNA_ORIENTATION=